MLNGLEISEVRFSDLSVRPEELFRLDAEFYQQNVISIWKNIDASRSSKLEDITNWITQGPNPVFSEDGYPCLTGRNVASGFVKLDDSDYVDTTEYRNLSRFVIRKGDVLITLKGLGSTGKVGFVHQNTDAIFSRNLGLIRANPRQIPAEFLMTFFLTKYGQSVIDRGVTGGTGQRTLPTTYLKGLKIPRFLELEQCIVGILNQAIEDEEESRNAVVETQKHLLKELGCLHISNKNNTSAKSFSESFAASGRLDAEFYQPKYDELFKRIHANADYVKTIGEMETFNARGLQPVYAEQGTLAVINSRHILEDGLDYDGFERTEDSCWDTQERARVLRNDILVYTTGANIGRSQPYLWNEPALASNHVNILRIEGEEPLYVAFVMNALIGRMQTDRLSAGTAQAELYPKDISQFVIPFVSKEKQQEIISRLLDAREKKAESHRLLEKAKQAVEIAIEKGEEAAIAYLEGKRFVAQTIEQDLARKAPYFSIDAIRNWLADQKMHYKPDTVKTYLSRQKKAGKIYDAGRGWYSSLAEPYQFDTAPVEKLLGELKQAFPLLDFACWSTAQLNNLLRHQLAKHVQFAYVERDAMESVADWLRSNGYRPCVNPGKKERKSFVIEENAVVILPLTTKSPHQDGFAEFGRIVVDCFADCDDLSIINLPELIDGIRATISSQRIDIAALITYAERRSVDLSKIEKGVIIH